MLGLLYGMVTAYKVRASGVRKWKLPVSFSLLLEIGTVSFPPYTLGYVCRAQILGRDIDSISQC